MFLLMKSMLLSYLYIGPVHNTTTRIAKKNDENMPWRTKNCRSNNTELQIDEPRTHVREIADIRNFTNPFLLESSNLHPISKNGKKFNFENK